MIYQAITMTRLDYRRIDQPQSIFDSLVIHLQSQMLNTFIDNFTKTKFMNNIVKMNRQYEDACYFSLSKCDSNNSKII